VKLGHVVSHVLIVMNGSLKSSTVVPGVFVLPLLVLITWTYFLVIFYYRLKWWNESILSNPSTPDYPHFANNWQVVDQ